MKVLIIDDNLDNKTIYNGRTFNDVEFSVINDELETLRTLTHSDQKFDAVLIDLSMPILDGFELASQIHLNKQSHLIDPNLKIGFFTGWPLDEDVRRAMSEAGVDLFVSKPIDPYRLSETMHRWLQP